MSHLPEAVPTVEVVLAGKPRKLAFTLGAMRRIKQATGHDIDAAESQKIVEVLGAYIWAMMGKEDRKELSVEDVEDCLHPGNLEEITSVFNQLVGGEPEGKAVSEVAA